MSPREPQSCCLPNGVAEPTSTCDERPSSLSSARYDVDIISSAMLGTSIRLGIPVLIGNAEARSGDRVAQTLRMSSFGDAVPLANAGSLNGDCKLLPALNCTEGLSTPRVNHVFLFHVSSDGFVIMGFSDCHGYGATTVTHDTAMVFYSSSLVEALSGIGVEVK